MMSEPVYILKLGLENVRCFGEKAELDLSDGNGNWRQWTVIVGDNGLGKTTLLQVLAGLETEERGSHFQFSNKDSFTIESISYPHLYSFPHDLNIIRTYTQLSYSLTHKNEKNEIVVSNNDDYNQYHYFNIDNKFTYYFPIHIFGYGANRFMSSTSLTDSKSSNSATLFNDDAKLINAEEWLLQLDYLASKQSEIRAVAEKRRGLVKETLKELLLGITDIRFTIPSIDNFQSNVEFETSFGWVRIHELSLGYKTMVAWMVDLAARMFERYPDSDNPLAEPAIVLVDEIDLHLHPKWQRKIFTYLSEKFPKTQFVVTAHSPLVVQSAPKDANLVVLRKEGDHVVIDNDVESVQSWRLDQILNSDLFDFIPTRGPATEEWMKKRQELLQKQTLTEDEQKELAELNRKANELPSADNVEDRESMAFIRKAADYLKNKVGVE